MKQSDNDKHHAVILRFPRKRGRPRSTLRGTDTGTPELVMKRLLGETAEALDICLERGIITPEQHWCGVHLRWLHTLRHGAPGVRAIDPTHIGGIENNLDAPEWRIAREKEYHDAVTKLMRGKQDVALIMNLCVYNERPHFLHKNVGNRKADHTKFIASLQEGLTLLAQLWGRKPGKA